MWGDDGNLPICFHQTPQRVAGDSADKPVLGATTEVEGGLVTQAFMQE